MSMLKFLSVKDCESLASHPGSRIRKLYVGKVMDNGTINLIDNGEEDLQDKINSFAESCDMQVIIRRFLNGEVDVLSKVQGFYADVTTMPKTYAEFMQRQIDAQNAFLSLPADVRSAFGNDVSQFLATAGDESWFKKLGLQPEQLRGVEPVEKRSDSGASDSKET